ncbi:MBL fold metallo-hydrolase [Alcanivorax sp. JB21]|uniref:MBL fold metallo-hydrolase RNA specificity domain-containing protein n=1 Tax=Alcanivorax limicola TaxID=2874102 RepID=UPI001CBA9F6B|nr:MBL fold metallo-hydrolase [Alcanivorax limicola]MBZ2189769.1 MBL fold metallo-hydrolase [Alcanivorax limicola]
MATITSLGAAREVTGSCHLLETAGRRILLDCGMHQGGDAVRRLQGEAFAFRPRDIDAVVLSHAHLDHAGLLPLLVSEGFSGPIYTTPATRNLLAIMLEDAVGLYLRDLEAANTRRRRAGSRLLKPRYDHSDVLEVLKLCQPLSWHAEAEIAEGLHLAFIDAGHILGSAIVCLRRAGSAPWRLVFSGDIGASDRVLMREPEVPDTADLVLMEGTYGNRDHRSQDATIAELEEVVAQAGRDGGNILMPAFAVGRTQELLFHLGCLYHRGLLNGWHVFLDSPMAIEVTRLYDQWLDALDADDQQMMRHFGARALGQFLPCFTPTASVDDSMQINRVERGAIIIAGSGMCNGGRIRHHLKHRLWQERNHIVFAGFQARGTLGRQLVDGAEHVRMFGQRYAVGARIHTLGGFSAHAGRTELIRWAEGIGGRPALRLVHGENEALESLAEVLRERGHNVSIAEPGSPFAIAAVTPEDIAQ